MNPISIGKRQIGPRHPCFIIAEIGVNHNGDIALARELIREAKRAGADCVKLQTFKAERLVTVDAPKAKYQLSTTDAAESQMDMLRKLELAPAAYAELIALAAEEDIILMSTPYNLEDVDFLDTLGFPAYKLASICIAEPFFLDYVARKGKPMIISTGMATLAEVDEAVRTVHAAGNDALIVLQCTTNYPSRLEDANLYAMVTMRDALNVMVGYSDHTQNHTACIAAVALGAHVIEKHFTLDKSLPGPDHSSSANPAEFAELVARIRETEAILGSSLKAPCEAERQNMGGMRRNIVAKQDIAEGSVITTDMLAMKRPALGLGGQFFEHVLGRRARVDIPRDSLIDWAMLA